MFKCTNINCKIVTECGQVCLLYTRPEKLAKLPDWQKKFYEPTKSESGHWFCGQFTD